MAEHTPRHLRLPSRTPLRQKSLAQAARAKRPVTRRTKPAEPTLQGPRRMTRSGVDVTLIRWMACLTPTQRLAVLHDHIRLVTALRRAALSD